MSGFTPRKKMRLKYPTSKLRECLPGNVEGSQATRCAVGTTVCPIGRRGVAAFVGNAVSQVSGMAQHPAGAILD